jgi:hypothetical protein
MPQAFVITGIVTEFGIGTPVDGVTITVDQNDALVWQGTTDLSGLYSVPYLPPGNYSVTVSKAGYLPETNPNVVVITCDIAHADFVIIRESPPPIGLISGLVTRIDGATPVEGAIVTAYPHEGGFVTSDTTGPDGSYILRDMQTVIYDVTAIRNRYISQTQYDIQVFSDQTAFVNFQLADSSCPYIPGDVNGSHNFNGIDVVFMVSYFKGGQHPTIDCHPYCENEPDPFYAAGDVNGDCHFNGLDVMFFILFFKGTVPHVRFCPDCPPSG